MPTTCPAGRARRAGARLLSDTDAGSFTVVMATGIVSIDASLHHFRVLADVLFAAAALAWAVLVVALVVQIVRGRRRRPRLQSFAFVAATAVLGARLVPAGHGTVALALLALAVVAWLVLVVLLVRRPAATDPGGGWFLVVVATESLAVLAALLSRRWGLPLLLPALAWWILGLCAYPVVARAVAARLGRPLRFRPDLWIVMGALAIATLAGAELLLASRALGELDPLHRWLRDIDVAIWVVASALVIPLVAAELNARDWRYCAGRWGFVFPLGMYAIATQTLGRATGIAFLADLAYVSFAIATLAWAAVLIGLVRASGAPSHTSRGAADADIS